MSTIDTHSFVKGMKNAGMPENQAEALNDWLRKRDSDLATKSDLTALRTELKADFKALEGKFSVLEGKFSVLEGKFVGLAGYSLSSSCYSSSP